MKVKLIGKDGGAVITRINNKNYDPARMEIIDLNGGVINV